MMRRLVILTMAMCFAATLHAQDNRLRDSLLVRLETTSDNEDRLKVLLSLTKATQSALEECRKYNDLLFAEAERQHNDIYKCEAYFTRVMMAYNTYDAEAVQRNADLLMPLARKAKCYDLMFRGWRCKIDYMTISQNFEFNEKEARKMLLEAEELDNTMGILEASQCLANIFELTFRSQQAMEILEKALPLAEKYGQLNVLSNIWQQLLFLYSSTGTYDRWLQLLQTVETHMMALSPHQLESQGLTLLITYTSFVDYYTKIKDFEKAATYLAKADIYAKDISSTLYMIFYNNISAIYYFRSEQYALALERINRTFETMGTRMPSNDYQNLLYIKALILHKFGRFADASTFYKEAITMRDSLQTAAINKQNDQLKKDFRADKLLLEQARIRQQLQIYTLILLIAGILAIGGFTFFALRSHKVLKKDESEMRAMTRRMKAVNEAKNRFLSNINATIREPLNAVVEGSMRLATHQIKDRAEEQALSTQIRCMSSELLKVINDILDLSRLEAGMMKFETTDAEVSSLLLDGVCAMESPTNKIHVITEYPENMLFMVRLDAARLQQVFRSLLVADQDEIVVYVREQWQGLRIAVTGSILAQDNASQEAIIRNEINKMLIVHFKGSYKIGRDNGREAVILYIPVQEIIRA